MELENKNVEFEEQNNFKETSMHYLTGNAPGALP